MNYRHACKQYEILFIFAVIFVAASIFIPKIAIACCNDDECPYHQACSGALCPLWSGTCKPCCDFWVAGGPIIKCCDGVACPLGNQYVCDAPHCFTSDCTKVHPDSQCGGYWCSSGCPGGGSSQCDWYGGTTVKAPQCLGTSGFCDSNCIYHTCSCIGKIPTCSDDTGCGCGDCTDSSQCSEGYCCDNYVGGAGTCRFLGYISHPYICA